MEADHRREGVGGQALDKKEQLLHLLLRAPLGQEKPKAKPATASSWSKGRSVTEQDK